jgi:hypothetical protein
MPTSGVADERRATPGDMREAVDAADTADTAGTAGTQEDRVGTGGTAEVLTGAAHRAS